MRKLEMRELAAYLPYGLKIQIEGKVKELVGLESPYKTNNNFYIHGIVRELNGTYRQTCSMCLTEKTAHLCKPLLIPMSELTPDFLADGFEDVTNYLSKNDIKKIVTEKMPLYYVPYGQLLRLVSWHFDVFNLIPSGLALNKLDFLTP